MRHAPYTNAKRHRGTNLIELVVVMSMQAVLLAAGVGLIGRMLQSEQAGRLNLETLRTIDALVEQFRQDAHAASDAALTGNDSLVLQLSPQRSVTYETQQGRLMRIEREADAVRRAEAYRLPPAWAAGFELLHESSGRQLRLLLTEKSTAQQGKPRNLTCDAVLGRDAEAKEVKS